MQLNQEQKKAFVDWLTKEKSITDFKCMVCGGINWGVLDDVIVLNTATPPNMHPNIGLICVHCNQTILFNAIESGILEISNNSNAPKCQACFENEATMQHDDGTYLCSDCYTT